jgi:LacI family transcriptional regulator, galactose operon repressor
MDFVARAGAGLETTIRDIAEQANVSFATVSRALNNKYGVKPATRKRVLEVARDLDYRPNAIARGLVKNQTNTIGLIIPDIKNPFFPEVAGGIEECAASLGYNVFLCNTNWSGEREAQYIELLSQRRVDGLIVAPTGDSIHVLDNIIHANLPVVYVSQAPEGTDRSFVVIDNVRGGFLATKHLIETGHGTIGFIGAPQDEVTCRERFEGYVMAFEKYGMTVEDRYVKQGDFSQTSGYDPVKEMLDSGDYPRGIFAANDLLAVGAIEAVKSAGMKVPEDIAVVGFDDIAIASLQEIQLSTINQPKYQMGKLALEILVEIIRKGEDGTPTRKVMLEPELIVRRSSEQNRSEG